VLTDDKHLQNTDNVVPAINKKASSPQMIAALDKVSAALDTTKLIALNKAVDIDRKSVQGRRPQEFVTRQQHHAAWQRARAAASPSARPTSASPPRSARSTAGA
jgi:osmoprotectant transport system substrate-binding protein